MLSCRNGIAVTGTTALLAATRTSDIAAAVTLALLDLAIGLTIVHQQHRLFAATAASVGLLAVLVAARAVRGG